LQQAQQRKQSVAKATLSLIAVGPLAQYGLLPAIGLKYASCVDFTPFI
jgi:hypothetical protein